jgi:hypothetical protein
MKTFAIYNGESILISNVADNFVEELLEGSVCYRELTSEDSRLAARYDVKDNKIIDLYPGKSDKIVLAMINSDRETFIESELERAKKLAIRRVQMMFNSTFEMLKMSVADYEPDTWIIQHREYLIWVFDKKATTPYIDALSIARGVDKDDLMEKVGEKIKALATIHGQQHMMQDLITQAKSIEEVHAII